MILRCLLGGGLAVGLDQFFDREDGAGFWIVLRVLPFGANFGHPLEPVPLAAAAHQHFFDGVVDVGAGKAKGFHQ